jgi:DNA repair protein RecN (Recombination protein N)
MLKSLNIQNYALIDSLELTWHAGMTAMTGETGSGKSIVLGALGLLLGSRSDTSNIRTGTERCTVEGVFTCPPRARVWLQQHDLDSWDELIVRREFSTHGRGRVFINDTPVKLQVLHSLGQQLVDLHGQDSAKLILQRDFQLAWIDANADHPDLLSAYKTAYTAFKAAQDRLAQLELKRSQPQSDLDYIRYQLEELRSLDLERQDWPALLEERDVLENSESIRESLGQAFAALRENDAASGALDRLHQATKHLDDIGHVGSKFQTLLERLTSVRIELNDVVDEIESTAEQTESNPHRLDHLNALHHELQRVLHKHHASDAGELQRLEQSLTEQLAEAAGVDEAYAAAKDELEVKRQNAWVAGDALMRSRQGVATKLSGAIEAILKRLSMPEATLAFEWQPLAEPDEHGIEEVIIAFSANPGHPALPLHKVASGGEKSRLMLAFKATGKGTDSIPTIVLDEIDTGVSGKVAEEMASLMHSMATNQQVIAVTHLPQVAALADHHLKVSKAAEKGTTCTLVTGLDKDQRVKEIAGMLSGSVVTEAAMANAASLLAGTHG